MSALSAEQARKLLGLDQQYAHAKAAMEETKRRRDEYRARVRPRLTLGQVVRAGGVEVTVKEVAKAASFRIAGYLALHKLTKDMQPFHTGASTREDWTVKRLPESP